MLIKNKINCWFTKGKLNHEKIKLINLLKLRHPNPSKVFPFINIILGQSKSQTYAILIRIGIRSNKWYFSFFPLIASDSDSDWDNICLWFTLTDYINERKYFGGLRVARFGLIDWFYFSTINFIFRESTVNFVFY